MEVRKDDLVRESTYNEVASAVGHPWVTDARALTPVSLQAETFSAFSTRFLKRGFDLLSASLGLLILAPFLLLIGILIKLTSPGPVFFRQVRVGRGQRRFRIMKFRTMNQDAEWNGSAITTHNDGRITRVGRFVRRFKLDELPQLINVLKGDMSLVGPRPEVPRYIPFYSDEEKSVFRVRPGITDLASIYYRNETDMLRSTSDVESFYVDQILPRKLRLNLAYLRRCRFWLDLKILIMTIAVTFLPSLFEKEVKRHIEAKYL
jgi:lipopolysaccharide/colanic/teichoic acid biosynthesis glycosyltransferase